MQMLYNSDSFAVVQFDVPADAGSGAASRDGFEIVDKLARCETYIQGPLAESFRIGVLALADTDPGVEALDAYIEGYTLLAQQPLSVH